MHKLPFTVLGAAIDSDEELNSPSDVLVKYHTEIYYGMKRLKAEGKEMKLIRIQRGTCLLSES